MTTNTEFAKTLPMPVEYQSQAAAFADAKKLSLAAREVVAQYKDGWVGNDGKRREPSLVLIVTADAMMALALRDGGRSFAPILTEFTIDGKEWVQAWINPTPPAACRVTFEVQGIDAPVVVVHTWAEYTRGKASSTQMKMPATMLGKATRSMGVRQIAPSATGGLLSEEEAHAVDNAVAAEVEHVAEIVQAVTPTIDADTKGASSTRAEQHAARREELVIAGKALRADFGAEAAQQLAVHIGEIGAKPDSLTAAHLKSILAKAKTIRDDFDAAAKEAAEAEAAEAGVVDAPPAAPEGLQDLADAFDGEFVI